MPFPIGGPNQTSISNGFRDIQCDAMVDMTSKQRSRSFILVPITDRFLIYDYQ